MCAASTGDPPMDTTDVYERLFQDRYTEREPGYAEVCQQPLHRIPVLVPWPPRAAARRSVWADNSERGGYRSHHDRRDDRNHGNGYSRHGNQGHTHRRHDSGGHCQYGDRGWGQRRRDYHDLDGVENQTTHKEDTMDFDACLKEYQLTKPRNGIAMSQETASDDNNSDGETVVAENNEQGHAGNHNCSEPQISTSALAKYRIKPKLSNDHQARHQPLPYQLQQQKDKDVHIDKKVRPRHPFYKVSEIPEKTSVDGKLLGLAPGINNEKAAQAQAAALERQRQIAESAARSQKVIQEALKAAGSVPRKLTQPPVVPEKPSSEQTIKDHLPKINKVDVPVVAAKSNSATAHLVPSSELVNGTKLRIKIGGGALSSNGTEKMESSAPVPSVNSIHDDGGHIRIKFSLGGRTSANHTGKSADDAKSKRGKHKHKKHKHDREDVERAPRKKRLKV